MPVTLKWFIVGALIAVTASAAYLMMARAPGLLLDLAGGLAACF